METIKLGKSQLDFTPMALGTWAFAGGTLWGDQDAASAIDTVHAALDAGVKVVDTADRYGNGASEELVGKALQGRRDQAVLCTKVYTDCLHYNDLIRCCEDSLRRLQTDYIDLYQIHWAAPDMPFGEAMEAFSKLKQDGKIREIGICNAGVNCLKMVEGSDMLTNQMCYSMLWRVMEKSGAMEATEAQNMKTWAYSPLAQGLLTGKYTSIDDVPMGRRANRMYNAKWTPGRHTEEGYEDSIFALLAQLRTLCDQTGLPMSALAMAFVKNQGHVVSMLVGARNRTQLMQNIDAFNANVPGDVVEQLDLLSRPLRDQMNTNADIYVSANGGRIF